MGEETEANANNDTNQNMIEYLKQLADHFKHITTLSSGFILVMATLVDKLFKNPEWPFVMALSFLLFVITIVLSLMAQAYHIGAIYDPNKFLSDRRTSLTIFSTLGAWGAFVLAVLSLVLFALKNFLQSREKRPIRFCLTNASSTTLKAVGL